jgi:diketogulonate reductase-like aldo/keto reductase
VPRVGLGTFQCTGAQCTAAVDAALRAGIRHSDTASIYKNHGSIRAALAHSGLSRQDVFITSKVSPYEQGWDKARAAVDACLQELGAPLPCSQSIATELMVFGAM